MGSANSVVTLIVGLILFSGVHCDNDAVVVNKAEPSTRLFTGNDQLDAGLLGVGLGVAGALVVGELLKADEKKQKCRYRRDNGGEEIGARFLGFGESKNTYCPPPPQHGYNPHGPAYHPPAPAPAPAYHQPTPGYNAPRPVHAPNYGYQAPVTAYPHPAPAYHASPAQYAPAPQYPQRPQSYRPPVQPYQGKQPTHYQPVPSYPPTPGYQRPAQNNYRPLVSSHSYQEPVHAKPIYNNYRPPSSTYQATRPPYRSGDDDRISGLHPRIAASTAVDDAKEEEVVERKQEEKTKKLKSDRVRFGN